MERTLISMLAGCCLLATTNAQAPKLSMPARSQLSPALVTSLLTSPNVGAPYAIFYDVASGPVSLLGNDLQLGFTPVMIASHAGLITAGPTIHGLPITGALSHGLTIYGQAIVLDPAAPNGLFRASNGASTSLTDTVFGCDFTMRVEDGYTGTFEQGYQQLIGAAPTAGDPYSQATSPWLLGSSIFVQQPDYAAPIVAQVLPFDTSIELEWRGAADFQGIETTEWRPTPDVANGLPYLQFRATFRASLITGARPILTNIVVPAY